MAAGLQKVPLLVSASLICAVPLSCGAASLAAGATFYMFMLSKMYEEYLEDYVYRLMAKIASRMCYMFKSKKNIDKSKESPVKEENLKDVNNSENLKAIDNKKQTENTNEQENELTSLIANKTDDIKDSNIEEKCESKSNSIDGDLNSINFHIMMFFLWMCVTLVNIPALLTWARNFKYSMVLKPDTSYYIGIVMSACSAIIWQMNGPRMNLKHYEEVSSLLFTMAVFILALGPFSLIIVNYGVTLMFAIITIQQLFDTEDGFKESIIQDESESSKQEDKDKMEQEKDPEGMDTPEENPNSKESLNKETASECEEKPSDCDECSESRIYNVFQNLREKFSFGND